MADAFARVRRVITETLNVNARTREQLQEDYDDVYDTSELQEKFKVIGFLAPFVSVVRREDGVEGSLMFQHEPRFYFNFQSLS